MNQKDLTSILDSDKLTEFLTNRTIDEFLNGIVGDDHPITDRVAEYLKIPVGAHLETPRMKGIYTHHGIYVGNKKVVHYAGLSDGLKTAPVEEVSLDKFLQEGEKQTSYKIIHHEHPSFSPKQIVNRAYSRISENNYNLIGNNCEHFVHWCIYNLSSSSQVDNALRVAGKTHKGIEVIVTATDIGKNFMAFLDGRIKKEKLFESMKEAAVPMTSSFYYAALGQAAIPIPVVGAFVGASVGYIVGSMLYSSGLIAFGDSDIVKIAKKRRIQAEKLCNQLIPIIQQSRMELEKFIDQYFSDRRKIFEKAFNDLSVSLATNDNELFLQSLEKINIQYGKNLGEKKTFHELIEDQSPPRF